MNPKCVFLRLVYAIQSSMYLPLQANDVAALRRQYIATFGVGRGKATRFPTVLRAARCYASIAILEPFGSTEGVVLPSKKTLITPHVILMHWFYSGA